jgi:hypothetical protein
VKRLTFDLKPMFDVPDDFEGDIALSGEMTEALFAMFRERGLDTISVGRTQSKTLRESVCRVGSHTFVEPTHFPEDRQLPDICPDHARSQEWDEVMAEHKPLFDAIEEFSGGRLKGYIEHTGGGTMTIYVPFTMPEPGHEAHAPLYMGLQEGIEEETGDWYGGVGFYATDENAEDGFQEDVVTDIDGKTGPREWARAIVEDWKKRTHAE